MSPLTIALVGGGIFWYLYKRRSTPTQVTVTDGFATYRGKKYGANLP